jgi:hypothetical protein
MHFVIQYTQHIKAATCFDTQLPSSESYCNKDVLANLRIFKYIFGVFDPELLLISTCAAYWTSSEWTIQNIEFGFVLIYILPGFLVTVLVNGHKVGT